MLKNPVEIVRRRALIVRTNPLVLYAESLRHPGNVVPDFDPLNGNEAANLLFLFEKPGPMTDHFRNGQKGSGLISPDNDDPTAEATFGFIKSTGIDRSRIAIWNTIPWWDGKISFSAADRNRGLDQLADLLPMFPKLRGVLLIGKQAQRAETRIRSAGLRTFESAHPSPRVRASNRSIWEQIPTQWAKAAIECDAKYA